MKPSSLRSAVCGRKKWSAGGVTAGTEPECNAEPQTEAGPLMRHIANAARDEGACCVAERAWARGGEGRPIAR